MPMAVGGTLPLEEMKGAIKQASNRVTGFVIIQGNYA
jgi:hypothetical protein